jgi:DNA-binding transcriptional LysR family regulator
MTDRNRTAPLDWEDVRFFLALARHGGLSAAARALGVNHATVARRAKGLEDALGAPLFDRRPDGYALTAAGRGALDAAGAMAAAADTLARLDTGQGPAGVVRVAATRSMVDGFLIDRLEPFYRRYPRLDLELIADSRSHSLARREADIALRLARPDDGELMARRVARVGFGFYGTVDWRQRLAAGETACFIGFDESSAAIPEARWLARHFPDGRIALRCDNHTSQAAAAKRGYGVALLPHFLAAGEPLLVTVAVPVPPAGPPPGRELWLLTRNEPAPPPPQRVVVDFLAELFRRERRLFEPEPGA